MFSFMRFVKFPLYAILFTSIIIQPLLASDFDPERGEGYAYSPLKIRGNLDNFADEKVLVLYRGINFLPDKFTQRQRLKMVQSSQVGVGMYASAVYEKSGLAYQSDRYTLLNEHGADIASQVNALYETDSITINQREFKSHRYAFQQLYSNNCLGFYKQLTKPSGNYGEIFKNFSFRSNPILSFSDRTKHPAKYGYGLKNFGKSSPLCPLYDINGRPAHPIVGKLYGIILDEASVEELMPLNVLKAHNSNYIRLNTNFRNDILSEREISLAGYVPGENVVFETLLQVPSFDHGYHEYYGLKYGLSQRRFNNFKQIFTSKGTTAQSREEKTKELMKSLIEPSYQANNMIYKNCLSLSVPSLFEDEMRRIGAAISTLNLDMTLEKK